MLRGMLGVVAGALAWMLGFFLLALLLATLWPDYAVHGRQWTRENLFTFTPLMACCNLLAWIVAELGAGWVVAKISHQRNAVWVLAALLLIYLIALHFILYWTSFPWWYNLGVVIPAVPAVWWGAELAHSFRGPTRTATT